MKSLLLTLSLLLSLSAKADDLPSWKDGSVKSSIIDFVAKVTNEHSPYFVKPADRIATFDNDGTLWSEVPTVEVEFTKQKLDELLQKDPKLAKQEPYKKIIDSIKNKKKTDLTQEEIMTILAKTHAGMTEYEFRMSVERFFQEASHPKLHVPYPQTAYKPMLELLTYLAKNDFELFICSGGETTFIRAVAMSTYGIPSQNIIGTTFKDKAVERNGKLVLVRTEELDLVNDKSGKPIGINRHIGKHPILSAGNVKNGGDIEHLRYSSQGSLPNLQLLINHDDAKREASYSEPGNLSLKAAKKYGWQVISIKNDWREVYDTASLK